MNASSKINLDKKVDFDVDDIGQSIDSDETHIAPRKLDLYSVNEIQSERICWVLYGLYCIDSIESLLGSISDLSKLIIVAGVCSIDEHYTNSENARLNELLKSGQLEVVLGDDVKDNANSTSLLLDRLKYDGWQPLLDKSCMVSSSDKLRSFYGYLGELLNKDNVLENTRDKHMRTYMENALVNLPIALATNPLHTIVSNYDYRPVLLVSAGPSLLKQLPTLKIYQDLFTIIAATATYPNLKKFDIEPDFLIAVDPTNVSVWDEDTQAKLIMDIGCDPLTAWSKPNSTMLCAHAPMLKNMLNQLGVDIDLLATGGSVATSAYNLAKTIGSNPIIMIGQDLAYTNGKLRTAGYAFNKDTNDAKANTKTFSVESWDGTSRVETDGALLLFKTWFENEFSLSEATIINSTEGGANLKGASSLPFKMVCEELNNYRLPKNEWELKKIDSGADFQNVLSRLIEFINRVKEYKLIARKGLKIAEKMRDQKKPICFEEIDQYNYLLKSMPEYVKNFCDSYSSVVIREIQRNVVRNLEADSIKAASYYMNIFYVAEQSAKQAQSFLERLQNFYLNISNEGSLNLSNLPSLQKQVIKFSKIDSPE